MEISPPTNMQQQGGVKLGVDGAFQMENVPEEMRAILADIQKKKEDEARASGQTDHRASVVLGGHAPPPPPPPPLESRASEAGAAQHRLVTENEATMRRGNSDMDTLVLFSQKEQEVAELQEKVGAQADEIESLRAQIDALDRGGPPPPLPPAATSSSSSSAAGADAQALKEATESREQAEVELVSAKAMATKLTAQLNAVSTLYTEAMQREAAMRVMLEQQGIAPP